MAVFSRRQALRTGLTAAAAVGLATAGGLPASAENGCFPDVPGMRGDRRANELWFSYEQTFAYQIPADVKAAYTAVDAALESVGMDLMSFYRKTRADGTYPNAYLTVVAPARDAFALLSRLQLAKLDEFYRSNRDGLAWAFLFMGEGVLYDPRMPDPNKVHMMNPFPDGRPTNAWHFWHAYVRAMTLQGIDVQRWNDLEPLIGLGWATQSLAKPRLNQINPSLDKHVQRRLIRQWDRLTPHQMDVAFDSFPHPS
nr:hypothetical protein [Kibdelosporangium sp. MJ126-NF4]CEL12837.1 putative secreted protein [Kibdelosporangium sp. MJ126-NF4]CTQ98523.1 putative secreted protein [Kibdelosporangium sp. MJ126-NF4]